MQQKVASVSSTALPDVRISGSVRAILTMNISKTMLDPRIPVGCPKDKRETRIAQMIDDYWRLRGGGDFAEWVCRLGARITSGDEPAFTFDNRCAELEALGYQAGLLSQYLVDQELMPTYLFVGKPERFAFAWDSEPLFQALAQDKKDGVGAGPLRQRLEELGNQLLEQTWNDWPIKRVRLSRYGAIQVILEHPFDPVALGKPPEFLQAIIRLGTSLGAKGLATLARASGEEIPGLETFLNLDVVRCRAIEVPVQWEMVGQIIDQMLGRIANSPADPDHPDLLHFDSGQPRSWRLRRTNQKHRSERDLPFRRRFLLLKIDELLDSDDNPVPLANHRQALAQLLDETPLVEEHGAARPLHLATARAPYLERLAEADHSTWEEEACFLSHDMAVTAHLQDPLMTMKLACDISYQDYWRIVGRTLEYLSELRLMIRLLEHKSSVQLEETMKHSTGGDMPTAVQNQATRDHAAATTLLLRLQGSSSPTALSQTGAMVSKLSALRDHFGLREAIRRVSENLAASERVVEHYQDLEVHLKSAKAQESIVNLSGRMRDLHLGLAAFTGILMGLTLPTFLREVFEHDTLKKQWDDIFGVGWETVTLVGRLVAVGFWAITLLAIVYAFVEVKHHLVDDESRSDSPARKLAAQVDKLKPRGLSARRSLRRWWAGEAEGGAASS